MRQTTVLIVDDEIRMRDLVRVYLEREPYRMLEAGDGRTAYKLTQTEEIDLIILDLMLPDLDGWQVCKRLREDGFMNPILMLTARGSVEDRVAGLRLGADDYLSKPFDGRELLARVQALLRRFNQGLPSGLVLRRGNLVIDTGAHTVCYGGRKIDLTPREFGILLALAEHPGHAFSREQLLARVWDDVFEGDERTIDSHIKNLREKLGEGASQIATVWGVGYRLKETR